MAGLCDNKGSAGHCHLLACSKHRFLGCKPCLMRPIKLVAAANARALVPGNTSRQAWRSLYKLACQGKRLVKSCRQPLCAAIVQA